MHFCLQIKLFSRGADDHNNSASVFDSQPNNQSSKENLNIVLYIVVLYMMHTAH